MISVLRRLIHEDTGQDLVEYGLLGACVVLASVAVWQLIARAVGLAYGGYDSNVQELWIPPDPPAPPSVP